MPLINPETQEAEAGISLEYKASLFYRANSRATQRNPVSGKKKKRIKQRDETKKVLSTIM